MSDYFAEPRKKSRLSTFFWPMVSLALMCALALLMMRLSGIPLQMPESTLPWHVATSMFVPLGVAAFLVLLCFFALSLIQLVVSKINAAATKDGQGNIWAIITMILVIAVVAAFIASASGLQIATAFRNELVITIGVGGVLAITGFLAVTLISNLNHRIDQLNGSIDKMRDGMGSNLETVKANATKEVRSALEALKYEVDAVKQNNPWLASMSAEKVNYQSNDLAVRFSNFFELEAADEHAAAMRMLYLTVIPPSGQSRRDGEPSASSQPSELAATPLEIDAVAEFALFALGDSELARRLHSRFSNRYDKDVVFLSSQLRSLIASFDVPGAEAVVRKLRPLRQQLGFWQAITSEVFFWRSKAVEIDHTLVRLNQNWRIQLSLSQYYWFSNQPGLADDYMRRGTSAVLDSRGDEERALFMMGLLVLRGEDSRAIDHAKQALEKMRIIPNRARMLFLVAQSARNIGDTTGLLHAAEIMRTLPTLDLKVAYFKRQVAEIVRPIEAMPSVPQAADLPQA
jgi:hypothetical protein